MTYIIGDGVSWFNEVSSEHEKSEKKSHLISERDNTLSRIRKYRTKIANESHKELLKKLEIIIVSSDEALFETRQLFGLKPSDGLFEKISGILIKNNYQINN